MNPIKAMKLYVNGLPEDAGTPNGSFSAKVIRAPFAPFVGLVWMFTGPLGSWKKKA